MAIQRAIFCSWVVAMSLATGPFGFSQTSQPKTKSPIEVTKLVADKMIRTTPFEYRLAPQKPNSTFDHIEFLNLARTFGSDQPGVAYALTVLDSPLDTVLSFQLSHSNGLKIWLNKQVVYQKAGDRKAAVQYKERAVELADAFSVSLKKGPNELLMKSETRGGAWVIYLRPTNPLKGLKLAIDKLPLVHIEVAQLANWLVIGPFPNPLSAGSRTGLDTPYEPERGFETGQIYTYDKASIAWTIPKIELTANGFGSTMAWGDNNYSWNYHAGGVAWAMAHLAEYTGEEKYARYSQNYCQFFLEKRPYLAYQKYALGGLDKGDTRIWESHMLDFTAAPTLPYTYWLLHSGSLANREKYEAFYQAIKQYVVHEQVRLPEGNFTRETPHRYTTWADDMYMGIPFLVQASRLSKDPAEKARLLEDAVNQIFSFNKQVWDPQFHLYRQTQYSDRKVKIPFWSRANGWGLWATSEVLFYLTKNHPKRPALLAHFRSHIDGLLKYQNPQTGFWHNLIDKPDSYQETSGTAIFVMAMARGINQGWLDRKKYEASTLKGWKAIESMVDADGTLHGTCVGTNMSEDIRDYYTRPIADDDTHGILPVLFAGLEVEKMRRNSILWRIYPRKCR